VKPPPEQFRDILESGGGEFLARLPSSHQEGLYVVSCPEDKSLHPKVRFVITCTKNGAFLAGLWIRIDLIRIRIQHFCSIRFRIRFRIKAKTELSKTISFSNFFEIKI
jgi:hypothetical protein